jgi:hypothetical protein
MKISKGVVGLTLLAGAMLAGCGGPAAATPHGTVRGYLEMLGGPPILVGRSPCPRGGGPCPHNGRVVTPRGPSSGEVKLSASGGLVITIRVPRSGHFRAIVPTGNYSVSGGPAAWGYHGCSSRGVGVENLGETSVTVVCNVA